MNVLRSSMTHKRSENTTEGCKVIQPNSTFTKKLFGDQIVQNVAGAKHSFCACDIIRNTHYGYKLVARIVSNNSESELNSDRIHAGVQTGIQNGLISI